MDQHTKRRMLVFGALAAALATAAPGFGAGQAAASVTVKLEAETLKITGTPESDKLNLVVTSGAPATIFVDIGADGTSDFSVDRSVVTTVDIKTVGGDDEVRVTGAVPDEAITIQGGAGNDTLVGGPGVESFNGGGGDDFVDGNIGADEAILGGGDDTFQWDPGDGSDTVDGQSGSDVMQFNGSNTGENMDISANGARVRFFRNIANITMDLDGIDRVNVRALGGSDAVVVNDLAGTDLDDVDVDLSAVGGGGDGSADSVTAVGTDGPDKVKLSSPGAFPVVEGLAARVVVEGVEATSDDVNVATLSGNDLITTGREVFAAASYNVDGGDGDDVTRYSGTEIADAIDVVANGSEVSTVSPLASRLDTTAVESLVLLGFGDADTMSAVGNLAALTTLTMDGGDGADTLRGGNGADLMLGGDGDDHVDGNQGADRALLGRGDDRFQWDPGDGSDIVEGQQGTDALDFNGSNIGENLEVSADGGRVRFTRNIASIVMDLDGIENVAVRALGGTDQMIVGDLRAPMSTASTSTSARRSAAATPRPTR